MACLDLGIQKPDNLTLFKVEPIPRCCTFEWASSIINRVKWWSLASRIGCSTSYSYASAFPILPPDLNKSFESRKRFKFRTKSGAILPLGSFKYKISSTKLCLCITWNKWILAHCLKSSDPHNFTCKLLFLNLQAASIILAVALINKPNLGNLSKGIKGKIVLSELLTHVFMTILLLAELKQFNSLEGQTTLFVLIQSGPFTQNWKFLRKTSKESPRVSISAGFCAVGTYLNLIGTLYFSSNSFNILWISLIRFLANWFFVFITSESNQLNTTWASTAIKILLILNLL